MPLTGIEIFKLLPKTNCGECGVPTCLAFAMSLAAGKAELTACPYVSEEAKTQLTEASAPPIAPLTIGTGDRALKIGGETVMFRHEKRFENPPGFAILINDSMPEAEVDDRLKKCDYDVAGFQAYTRSVREVQAALERVKSLNPKVITVIGGPHPSGDPEGSMNHLKTDYAFRGEAEIGIVQLMKSPCIPLSKKNWDAILFPTEIAMKK